MRGSQELVVVVDSVLVVRRGESKRKQAGKKGQKQEQREGEDNLGPRGGRITQRAYAEDWISQ